MKKNQLTAFFVIFLLSTAIYAEEASPNGEILFKQCAGCHGQDGKNRAFGKSGIIAGQDAKDLMESLKFYKESEFKTHSTTTVMAKQVKNINYKDLTELANYVSKLKK